MYNRAMPIRRCLDSILSQDFEDYEIIVVDDASEDNSVAIVESYMANNPQIRLIKNSNNRGCHATKGIGANASCGQWVTVLDSDDAFHPGALKNIHGELSKAPPEVGVVRFCYWSEQFSCVTPYPTMPEGIIGLPEFLQWQEGVKWSDLLYCHRREIYDKVSWPTDRRKCDLFHLRVASKYKGLMSKQVVGTMYDDANNRITREGERSLNWRVMQQAHDQALDTLEILDEFGDELRRYCPKRYKLQKRMVGGFYFQAGCRLKGCRYMFPYLVKHPLDVIGWGMLVLGLVGPRATSWGRRKFSKKISAIRTRLGIR
jgi:glycosyltransferase involved in cell wall biosynthesis